MTKVLVNVTDEDIRLGMPITACECPIYLALEREKVNVTAVSVNITIGSLVAKREYAYIILIDYHWEVELSDECLKFIRAFDSGKRRVVPFVFELELPEDYHPAEIEE